MVLKMDLVADYAVMRKYENATIMCYFSDEDGWEVYYRRRDFPYIFAFGLPRFHTTAEVFEIAAANIAFYEGKFLE